MKLATTLAMLVVGWLILILQSTVVSYITSWLPQPEFLLVLLVYAGVNRGEEEGFVLAIAYGYLMDLFSGQVFGTYLSIYLLLLGATRLLSVPLLLQTRLVQALLVFVFSLTAEGLQLGLQVLTLPDHAEVVLRSSLVRACSNMLGSLVLFPILGWVERRSSPRPDSLELL